MIFDLIFATAFAVFAFKGYKKGIVIALCSFVGIVLGVMGALKLSGSVATHLFKESNGALARWAPSLTYLILFLLIVWLVQIIGKFVEQSVRSLKLGWANRLAGACVYGLLVSFVFSSFLWLGAKLSILNEERLASSVTAPVIAPIAPKLVSYIGVVLPFTQSVFGEIGDFYDSLNETLR